MKFYKGQRVRLARARYKSNLNAEGFFGGYGNYPKGTPCLPIPGHKSILGDDNDCTFISDASLQGAELSKGEYFCRASALEPIVPEGHKVVAWEDCLWNPKEYA